MEAVADRGTDKEEEKRKKKRQRRFLSAVCATSQDLITPSNQKSFCAVLVCSKMTSTCESRLGKVGEGFFSDHKLEVLFSVFLTKGP